MLAPIVYRRLTEYSQQVVDRAKARLRTKPLPDSSDLIRSIKYNVAQNGTVTFEYNQSGEYVDSGRRRGATPPPVRPIAQWIKSRGLDLNAYAVAKSIGKNGIKPFRWLDVFPDGNKPNSRASLELATLWEELTILQIEADLDDLEI